MNGNERSSESSTNRVAATATVPRCNDANDSPHETVRVDGVWRLNCPCRLLATGFSYSGSGRAECGSHANTGKHLTHWRKVLICKVLRLSELKIGACLCGIHYHRINEEFHLITVIGLPCALL